jgi:hypothetical protein
MSTDLARLQEAFQDYVLRGEGPFLAEVTDGARTDALTRLGVYVAAYRLRLIEALETDFVALRAVLGPGRFESLCRAYIDAYPSDHYSLRYFGRHLARFLAQTEPWRNEPLLAELARFEWALVDAFDAADSEVATPQDMAGFSPEQWPGLVFRPHASVQRLDLEWNVPFLWQANDRKQALPAAERAPHLLGWVVWRQGLQNYFRSLDAAEAFALDAVLRGDYFAAICEGLTEWIDAQNVAAHAAGLLRLWLTDGLIREIKTE